MTGQGFAAGLPFPLVCASIILASLAMVSMSLASHGYCDEAWGNLLLLVATFCLVLALIVGWTTA